MSRAIILFSVISLLLSSCNPSERERISTIPASPTVQGVSTSSHRTEIVPTSSLHPTVGQVIGTPSPSPLPSSIPITTRTITPTIKPTLTSAEREKKVIELFRTNDNCKLPCWWGVKPGNSSWLNTESYFQYLGSRIIPYSKKGDYLVYGIGGISVEVIDNVANVSNGLVIWEKDGLVEVISVLSDGVLNRSLFARMWKNYSPQNLMKDYGKPSRILIHSRKYNNYGSSGMTGYMLWLFYDANGFVFQFDGQIPTKQVYHVCPRFEDDIDRIQFITQSSNVSLPLERIYQETFGTRFQILPLEEASDMSVEKYYQESLQGEKPACFDVPSGIWDE